MNNEPEAHAQMGDFGRTVEVVFTQSEDRQTWVAAFEDGPVPVFHRVEEGVAVDPTMRLTPALARSLYSALAPIVAGDALRHDHARQDYLHERGRVDKLLDTVTDLFREGR